MPADVLPLLVFGIVLGYSYERCGRLIPAIIIHAIFNAIAVVTVLTA